MSDERVRAAVVAERTDMADLLAGLRPEQWDEPTLCQGWRVREVVAHITQPFRMPMWRVVLELARARGDVNRMADRSARRDAARMSADQLLQQLRDNVAHPWTPPGGGAAGALSHDVIHGLDITVALRLDRTVPPERLRPVLAGMRPRNVAFFGADLAGAELRATDLDWSYGAGQLVRGRAQDLLLVVCGRRLPAGHLDGPAASRFTD
ncbi:maleylpyruvate isomerase family mycothiol-dependent enzyme [Couchioplanes caeruleus]|uniref:maleylpyruvate isomerase family mycothiol-dependent enzyme n=1 Tax=Couchioplanes caeruleus TaxID=56438 RepID=UPI0020BF85DC|nr:maleylpyruvate isomerase family mycothiol-dependent enzyme [Couchioplanes caeruleus]UQU63232.1 maleylpyruvate isomerase family mycothiol-dependent enzyme [Couchioplanes caeruleus]